MVKDIKVGQKFLSGSEVGEILTTTRKDLKFPVIWLGATSGEVRYFTEEGKWPYDRDSERDLRPIPEPEIVIPEGVDFKITSKAMTEKCRELQKSGRKFMRGRFVTVCEFDNEQGIYRMIPITITEGVEFSGEAYRSEFERLVKEGREFEIFANGEFRPIVSGNYVDGAVYVMLPQHRDANGNPLKVGDRVEDSRGRRFAICRFSTLGLAIDANGNSETLKNCRLLTTRTRPLCLKDLEKAQHPMFLDNEDPDQLRIYPQWVKSGVYLYWETMETWESLAKSRYQWRPSADKPWGPCEVTEEVLA